MTIKDIAERAGVSITTVSKILNGCDGNISEATRSRVKLAIEETNYVTNAVARGLKTKKTKMIGFVLPDIANPFFPQIARGIEDIARSEDFGVIYCNTDDDAKQEQACMEFLKSQMVAGIIYTRALNGSQVKNFASINIPMVIMDRMTDLEGARNIGKVYVDVTKAIYESTSKMAQAGCREIACISSAYSDGHDRYFGYVKALESLGVPLCDDLVYLGEFDLKTGYDGMLRLLESGHAIDGVVCGNDLIAIGALNALRYRGIRVPQDIKVIGLDDIYMANFTNPRLSTMAQPTMEMGRLAATMLIAHLQSGAPLYEQVLSHHYVRRETL